MNLLFILVISLLFLTAFGTLYYGIMKRKTTGWKHHLNQAWLNIFMGGLFISIALILILTPDYRLWRIVLITLIFLLGCINLFAGLKNRRRLLTDQKEAS